LQRGKTDQSDHEEHDDVGEHQAGTLERWRGAVE
jgi:hypothetical protein